MSKYSEIYKNADSADEEMAGVSSPATEVPRKSGGGFMSAIGRGLSAAGRGIGTAGSGLARGIGGVIQEATASPTTEMDPKLFEEIDYSKYGEGIDPNEALGLPNIDDKDPDKSAKEQIHEAYKELWKLHTENVRRRGAPYMEELKRLQAEQKAKPVGQKFSPLAAFAIGLGNPAALANVQQRNATVDQEVKSREDALSAARAKAIEGHIQQLNERGKFKEALMTSAIAADLKARESRVKGEQEAAIQKAKTEANMTLAKYRIDQMNRILREKLGYNYEQLLAEGTMKARLDQLKSQLNPSDNLLNPGPSLDESETLVNAFIESIRGDLARRDSGGGGGGGTGGGTGGRFSNIDWAGAHARNQRRAGSAASDSTRTNR